MSLQVVLLCCLTVFANCAQSFGPVPYKTTINGEPFELTTTEFLFSNTPRDSFYINGTGYQAGPAWAIIRLDEGLVYNYTTYAVAGKMSVWGSMKDLCPPDNILHKEHEYDPDAWTRMGFSPTTDCSWCFSVIPTLTSPQKSYIPKMGQVMAYSNFVGMRLAQGTYDLDNLDDYTLSLNVNSKPYADNGLIMSYSTKMDLANLRYDGRTKKLTTIEALLESRGLPDIRYNVSDYSCNVEKGDYSVWEKSPVKVTLDYFDNTVDLGFTYYQALRPGLSEIKDNKSLFLTVYGMTVLGDNNWIVDPCLELIYPITFNNPYWYTNSRVLQRATNQSCLIIQDSNDKNDLGVYTFSGDAMRLVPTSRFKGLLSRDLITTMIAKITTQWEQKIDLYQVTLFCKFLGQHSLTLHSNVSSECSVYMAPNLTLTFSTGPDKPYSFNYSAYLPLHSRITYTCGAANGWINAPTEDSTLAARYTPNTTNPTNVTWHPVPPTKDPPGGFMRAIQTLGRLLSDMYHWLTGWMKIALVFLIILAILCLRRGKQTTLVIEGQELPPLRRASFATGKKAPLL